MIKLNCLSAKRSSVNEHLITIHQVFHIKTYIPALYILQLDSYVVKSAKIINYLILGRFVKKSIKYSSYCHGKLW